MSPKTGKPGLPQDFSELVSLLQTRAPSLPKRLRQVADHLMAHPDDVAFHSTSEIARKAGVQPSTLVRFAQALDYAGFSELQQVFRHRLLQQTPDHRARLAAIRGGHERDEAPSRALLEGFVRASHASLEQLVARIDPRRIDEAAERLAGADTLLIIGARRMFALASYFAYAFGKLGIRAVLIDNIAALGAQQAAIARPSDALIAISCAPYSSETIDIAAAAFRAGVPVVALTDSPLSPLVPHCETWLEIAEADFGAFRSMAASFALAMTLAVATAEKATDPIRSD